MKLKRSYSAREVAVFTGLSARQLQWWDARRLFSATVASRPTKAGGFTERRYSPIDLYELLALADLRRQGFTVQNIRTILSVLREQFNVRLFDALGVHRPRECVRHAVRGTCGNRIRGAVGALHAKRGE